MEVIRNVKGVFAYKYFKPGALALCLILLAILAGAPQLGDMAYGRSYERRLQDIRNEKKKIEQKIRDLKGKKGDLTSDLKALDKQYVVADEELEGVKQELKKQEDEQAKLEAELERLSEDLDKKRIQLGQRSVEIYKQGEMTYLDLVLDAENFSDFIDRVFFLQIIYENDQTLIKRVQDGIAETTLQKIAVQQKINEINEIKAEIEARIEDLREMRAAKSEIMKEVEKDLKLYEKQVDEFIAESKRIQAELAKLARSGGSYKGKPWTSNFLKPVNGPIVSGYGYRVHPILRYKKMHYGVDISAPSGTPIKAGGDGKVIFADWRGGYGQCIMIDHGKGIVTLYAHLSKISVKNGQVVKAGAVIGNVGSTGLSTGPHLHFEVRINGDPVDPLSKL